MSVDSHFPAPPDLRMPKNPEAVDELGIRYEGPVLTGLLGVRQAFRKEAGAFCGHQESNLPGLAQPAPLLPQPPNAADALVSVDPVMAGHRAQFGPPPSTTNTHPEQYDPVLRHHLRMEPAPDPYEDRRRREAYWQSIRAQHVK